MAEKLKNYDVVVVGAGSGGLTAAIGFAKVGKKTLLIEKEHIGGECTNSGCVPSKALLHHAKSYHAAQQITGKSTQGDLSACNAQAEEYRSSAFTYVREKIDAILEEETPEKIESHGVDVIMGEAKFSAKCCVEVGLPAAHGTAQAGDTTYRFKRAVIATGSSPRMIDIQGVEEKDVLTNQNIFELNDVPERLLIIGAGPIGMEMAQAFSMLGSRVTMAAIDSSFARLEDPAVSAIIEQKFIDLGIDIKLNAYLSHVENRQAIFDIKAGEKVVSQERVAYDKVLVAIGRVPNFPKGLDVAGIEINQHGIMVDGQYRTSNKYVFALGDVSQRLKFTHTANDVARQVVARVASHGLFRVDTKKAVPKVTYTQPEIAAVGISHEEACRKYDDMEVMRLEVPYSASDRAKTDSAETGLMVVVVRRINGAVLGANIIGAGAGEIISLFTLAIDRKISMWKLRNVIYSYPTYSALVQKAGDQFLSRQVADLKMDLWRLVKKHAPKLIALTFWGILIYNFQHYRISNELSYTDMLLNLVDFFTMSMWGPLVYIALYALRPLILFPATLLTALSGVLFGFWGGVVYTLIGENMSANFAYWIGRFFGKDLRLEDSVIGNWVNWLRKRPFESVLFMRLFYVPFDLANYGSGVLRVKWGAYALATLIGIIPGMTTFIALGAALNLEEFKTNGLSFDAFDPKFLALSVTIFVTSIILSKFLKKWKANRDEE